MKLLQVVIARVLEEIFKCPYIAAALIYGMKNVSNTDGACQWGKIKQV